jgi:hypothetical protein
MEKIESCAICAWRETCQKKFSISGRAVHCPEFVRDIRIKNSEEEEKKGENLEEDSQCR